MTPSTSKFAALYARILLRRPGVVLLLCLAITLALGSQAPRFTIDASPDSLLTKDNELYTQAQLVSERFSPQEFLLVTYEPHAHPVLSQETFTALRALSDELLTLERVQSVRSIINVPVFTNSPGLLTPDMDLASLTIESGNYDLATLTTEFTDHPIYTDLLVNADLSATALQVLFRTDPELQQLNAAINAINLRYQAGTLTEADSLELKALKVRADPLNRALTATREQEIASIRHIIDQFNTDATIHMGGVHVLANQLIQIIANDLVVFGMAIGLGICLMLSVMFRAWRWVAIPVLCCVCSLLATMGLFALLDIRATVISSNFIALQLILTLAIVIHLIVQYRENAAANASASEDELITATLQDKIGPCFFAGVTTSVGFGSLIFSGIQPIIAFGWMMIIAMFFSIAVSLVLFPALLALLPTHAQRPEWTIVDRLTTALAQASLQGRPAVIALSLALLGLSIAGMLRLDVENSFINYFRQSTQVHQELAYIDQQFGGTTPLDLVYASPDRSDNSDIVMTAQTVQTLQLIQYRMQEHAAVGRILSPVNLTDLARELNGGPLTEYELTAAYWLMDADFREDLLGSFYDADSGQARFNIWIKDLTEGLSREQLLADIRSDMEEIGIDESSYTLTNMLVLYQDILQRLFSSQILTLGLVFGVLTLVFLLIFRSLTLALMAMIPNILPTLIVLGVMGWLDIPLDLMTITIAAIAMGIAVDGTIHYIHRYLAERETNDYAEAIRHTHASVGVAIFYTALLVITGFSMLGFSDFVPTVLFGLLISLAMLLATLGDLCLLPVLLRWLPVKAR